MPLKYSVWFRHINDSLFHTSKPIILRINVLHSDISRSDMDKQL